MLRGTSHRALVLVVLLVSAVLPLGFSPPVAAQRADAPDAGTAQRAAALPAFDGVGANKVRLMAGAFDPLADELPPVPDRFAALDAADLDPATATYWLVQPENRDYAAATAAIEQSGAGVVDALAGGVYVMRATPVQRAAVDAADGVRWTGPMQPAWKMPVAVGDYKALWEIDGVQTYLVYAFDDEHAPAEMRDALAEVDGARVGESDGRATEVQATTAQLPAITAIPSVEWVEIKPTVVPLNMNARWVNDTGVRDLYAATADGRLNGAGQTAAVADTGVNYTTDSQGRALSYFRDCADGDCKIADYTQKTPGNAADALNDVVDNNTDHRKMAAYFDIGASGPEPSDDSAHGTHVAGSVTGDTDEYGSWQRADGMAPGARLVHQNIATVGGGLSTPSDSYRLFGQAYRPRNPAQVNETANRPTTARTRTSYYDTYVASEDARTHNNSYGLVAPVVSLGSAEQADRFVWDNEDMVIVSSAGNAGPDPYSMGAPSVGKNVLSSGASANGRQPMVSLDSMASFSSHGPTGDQRFGVDLATPGQIVVSAKGGSSDGEHYLQGTSMSGPILTGLATLVREYFWDGYGPGRHKGKSFHASGLAVGDADTDRRHNPSAALVRASMVNGADRMRGYYTGDDGTQRALDGQYPSAGQGFGLVNLSNALFFDDATGKDTLANWYHDVYRADAHAFKTGTGAQRAYTLHVEEGAPLSVTLAYSDAPNALPQGTPALLNNLDLIVTAPDGTMYVGNNFNTRAQPDAEDYVSHPGPTPTDARNPVERVRIAAPQAGEWTVTVRGTDVPRGDQGFALAASGHISDAADQPFQPGPPLQTDVAGAPTIDDVATQSVNGDLVKVTWSTNEPTTGTVTTTIDGEEVTFVDSYNQDNDGFYGIDEATVETSEAYAGKPVLGTQHEALLTGLSPGQTYDLQITATDLADTTTTATTGVTTPGNVIGAEPGDIGQLVEDPADAVTGPAPLLGGGGWKNGTQLYAGKSGGAGLLGAFMFRVPESIDPDKVVGAAVELTSAHNVSNLYKDNVRLYVDLLNQSVEPDWGTQNYSEIHNAERLARLSAETGLRRGGGKTYPFSFTCSDIDKLRQTLGDVTEGERLAAFRFDAQSDSATSLFSMEFGFNRRSKGPELRPRLVLYVQNDDGSITGVPATDGAAPKPTITDVGVQEGLTAKSVTVTWTTDVPSDSTVLYREQGTEQFTQVGSRSMSTIHMVQVFGLDRTKDYEFAVRSASEGGETTDDNGGEGYKFFHPKPGDVPEAPYYFHGEPTDNAQKLAQFGGQTTATFSEEPPTEAVPVQQTMTGVASTSFAANPLAAYWMGNYSGDLNGPLTFDGYFSTTGPPRMAAINVTVFADADPTGGVQPDKIVASGSMSVDVTQGPVPVRSVGSIDVAGQESQQQVDKNLIVQISGAALTDDDLIIHYDSESTPSAFGVPEVPTPKPEGPRVGPIPPLSAESTGLAADLAGATTRTDPLERDIAAGTSYCSVAAAVVPGPDDPGDNDNDNDTGGNDNDNRGGGDGNDGNDDRDDRRDDSNDGGVGNDSDARRDSDRATRGGDRSIVVPSDRSAGSVIGAIAATGIGATMLAAIALLLLLAGTVIVRRGRRRRS